MDEVSNIVNKTDHLPTLTFIASSMRSEQKKQLEALFTMRAGEKEPAKQIMDFDERSEEEEEDIEDIEMCIEDD